MRLSQHIIKHFSSPPIFQIHVTRFLIPCCPKCFIVVRSADSGDAKLEHYLCRTPFLFSVSESVFPWERRHSLNIPYRRSSRFCHLGSFLCISGLPSEISAYPLEYHSLLLEAADGVRLQVRTYTVNTLYPHPRCSLLKSESNYWHKKRFLFTLWIALVVTPWSCQKGYCTDLLAGMYFHRCESLSTARQVKWNIIIIIVITTHCWILLKNNLLIMQFKVVKTISTSSGGILFSCNVQQILVQ